MTNFSEVYRHLRRKNWRQYSLLAGCAFVSVLLITAYACIMRSPTILAVLPEGGDSRKQVMMIFVLAVIGCAVFTVYASGLFFRHRSRQTGILLALGASRRQLRRQLDRAGLRTSRTERGTVTFQNSRPDKLAMSQTLFLMDY